MFKNTIHNTLGQPAYSFNFFQGSKTKTNAMFELYPINISLYYVCLSVLHKKEKLITSQMPVYVLTKIYKRARQLQKYIKLKFMTSKIACRPLFPHVGALALNL
jgi:hypothetical protein